MPNLVWFRADLRTEDNPALYAALDEVRENASTCVAVYHLCPVQWDAHSVSPHKRSLILRQLKSLERDLAKLNVPFRIINSQSFAAIPDDLVELCCRLGVEKVYYNYEYELNERKLTRLARSKLKQARIETRGFHDQCMIAPGEILNGSGEMYQVFTAFKNRYLDLFDQQARNVFPRPKPQKESGIESDLKAVDSVTNEHGLASLWPAGEDEAQQRLQRFVDERISDYKAKRDLPAVDATSTLSPYLATGILSVGQCFQAILDLNSGTLASEDEGVRTWVSELVWREFYRHFLFAQPQLCQHKAFKSDTEALPWKHDEARLKAWQEGNTGFPIVDAGMRQLNQTGWMHNRLRMICAMFLSKHLFLDWRLGEQYFMEQLVDGDFASNNGGWQWSASTGVDAAPYFRIFNPTRQSERFDADGAFIRRYVPELSKLDKRSIHDPKPEQRKTCGYPQAIVDHRSAVEQTKDLFASLSGKAFKSSVSGTDSIHDILELPLTHSQSAAPRQQSSAHLHTEKAG